MQCNFSMKFYRKSYKNGQLKESRRCCFKLWGGFCTYTWFRQKTVLFHLCKGAIHKISISMSHLYLQSSSCLYLTSCYLILLLVFAWKLWASSTAHCLISPCLFWNVMDVVELGQGSQDVQCVHGFCASRVYHFTWHLVKAPVSWTRWQNSWWFFLKHQLLQRILVSQVKIMSR